jgi:hypothetical protein
MAGVTDLTFGTDGALLTDIVGAATGVAPRAGGGYWLGGSTGAGDLILVALTSSGHVDNGFGGGDGIETVNLGGTELALGMAVDPSGNMLLAGASADPGEFQDVALARFTSDGLVDDGFGTGVES